MHLLCMYITLYVFAASVVICGSALKCFSLSHLPSAHYSPFIWGVCCVQIIAKCQKRSVLLKSI